MIDKKAIEIMIEEELAEANEKHHLFQSPHEAYAVLLEEVEEMEDEVRKISDKMEFMWDDVKYDRNIETMAHAIYDRAVFAIQEAIQVAAVCKKIKQSELY